MNAATLSRVLALGALIAGPSLLTGPARAEAPCTVSVAAESAVRAGEPTTLRFDVLATESALLPGDRLALYFPDCSPHSRMGWSRPGIDPDSAGFVFSEGPADVAIEPHPREVLCGDLPILFAAHLPDLVVLTVRDTIPTDSLLRFVYRDGAAQLFPESEVIFRMQWKGVGRAEAPWVEWTGAPITVGRVEPFRLHLTGPSQARPNESVRLRVAALDLFGFPSRLPRGVTCSAVHESGATWGPLAIAPSGLDDAVGLLEDATFPREGAWWVSVHGDGLEPGWDLPVWVADSPRTLRWGDLHWHSNRSDGSRSPREGYVYARDIVGLDFTAKTDHDHHARHPCLNQESWNETIELANEFEVPGEFAALVAWEYTWNSGHHNVYFRGLDGPYLPVSKYPEIEEIWAKLTPGDAITIPHHPASTKQPHMRWEHRDARFQTVVEIFSNKGNSEAPTGPLTVLSRRDPRENPSRPGSAQEGWSLGASFGVIGSTDTHYAVPGAPIRVRNTLDDQHDAGPGICAMWIDTLDRGSVFDGLLAGNTYATTGPRIRVEFDAHVEEGVLRSCSGNVLACGDIASVEVIGIPRDGPPPFPVVASLPTQPSKRRLEFDGISLTGADELRGVYLRVTQKDTEMAWSSPIFVAPEHP